MGRSSPCYLMNGPNLMKGRRLDPEWTEFFKELDSALTTRIR